MSEKDLFLHPAFQSEPLSEDFDPNILPSDGIQYLQSVQYEAMLCEQVVTAKIDEKKINKKESFPYCNQPVINMKCKELLPSQELQNDWIAQFSDVRMIVERRRAVQSNHTIDKKYIPNENNKVGWYEVCVGQFIAQECENLNCENDIKNVSSGSTSDSENDDNNKRNDVTNLKFEYTLPKLQLLSVLSQETIADLLEYHICWLKKKKTDFPHSGCWLYALLSCLDTPLKPGYHSIIRKLARLAVDYRSKLESPNDPSLQTLNLIICLIGKYFRQLDLADN